MGQGDAPESRCYSRVGNPLHPYSLGDEEIESSPASSKEHSGIKTMQFSLALKEFPGGGELMRTAPLLPADGHATGL